MNKHETKAKMYSELQCYQANIKSIMEIFERFPHVSNTISTLNLHCNQITKISHLNEFIYLTELNLSSNQIMKMEGLSCLPQLTILNLASNKIKKIEGLGELKSLKKLVLAFNNIESLAGLVEISGNQYNLEYLDIRNNKVSSLNELNYISGLVVCTFVFSSQ